LSVIIKGGASSNTAEVNVNGELKVDPGEIDANTANGTVGNTVPAAGVLGHDGTNYRRLKVDAYGSQSATLMGLAGVPNPARPDSQVKFAVDPSPLLTDTFDAALDVTDRWTTGGTAPTSALGTLTISPSTTALAVSSLTSKVSFPLLGNMYNQTLSILKVDSGLKTQNYRFSGLGNAQGSPTVAAPVQDGVGFEWLDTTGVLQGCVWSAGARLQSLSLASVQPTDGAFHRYSVYFKTSRVYFEIDNVAVGSIAYPNPNVSNLPLLDISVNGASTVTPAAVMQATFLGVGDSSKNNGFISDATFPWRKASVGKSGGVSVRGAAVVGASTSIAAAGTGTIGPVDVSEAGNVTFTVKNTIAGSAYVGAPVLVFEQSDDNVSWGPLPVTNSATGAVQSTWVLPVNTASASTMFDAGAEGINWVRCRCTTGPTTNALTVVITPGGMPFTPSVALYETGRTAVAFYGNALAVGATTVEAALTLTRSAGTAATSSAASFVATNGKRLRLTELVFSQVGNAVATAAESQLRLRLNTAGAVITTTTPVLLSTRIATPAVASSYQNIVVPIPLGFEITGNGTIQFGFTVNSTYVTNAPTVDVMVIGYEY
jgi:hypothetical protein